MGARRIRSGIREIVCIIVKHKQNLNKRELKDIPVQFEEAALFVKRAAHKLVGFRNIFQERRRQMRS